MRAPISIIIPTLNAESVLPACLSSLAEGLHAGLVRELIVSDGGSTDATCTIADAAGARVVHGKPSRGGQLRRGAEASEGAWLLVLHADTTLAPGWTQAVAEAVNTPGAYHFALRFRQGGLPGRWVAGWANMRARVFGLPYGDQGLLVDRATYLSTGGYPDQPLMEDVAIARALRGRLRGLPVTATTSAEKYERQGWLRRGSRNLVTLMRYLTGVDPERLAAAYRR